MNRLSWTVPLAPAAVPASVDPALRTTMDAASLLAKATAKRTDLENQLKTANGLLHATQEILPGGTWKDTNADMIEAQRIVDHLVGAIADMKSWERTLSLAGLKTYDLDTDDMDYFGIAVKA